jgi:hypothetical protein
VVLERREILQVARQQIVKSPLVSAGPGCGKSVLSRCLIDEGQLTTNDTIITITHGTPGTPSAISSSTDTTSTVCYFFFKDGGDGRMDVLVLYVQYFTSSSNVPLPLD